VFSGVELVEPVGLVVLGVVVLDLGLRAQGGRSEPSWEAALAATSNAATVRIASCFTLTREVHIRELRCRFHRGCRRRHGRQFSIGPHGAVFEVFFFPNRHSAFEGVDGVAAGVEGGGAVGSAYRDVHAGFSNFEPAKAVDHGNAMDGKLIMDVSGDLLNFGKGHGLVSLVLEVQGAAVFGMVADESVEDHHGAVSIPANISRQSNRVYGLVNERNDISRGGGHGYTSATTYGGQEGYFIASTKNGVPWCELLIAGRDQRGAVLLKFGITAGILGKKRFDIGLGCQVHGFLGASGDFFQAAEKQHLDTDGLGKGRHEKIVTCVQRWD
jgi:hypothetical protein